MEQVDVSPGTFSSGNFVEDVDINIAALVTALL